MRKKKILFVYPSVYNSQYRIVKSRQSFFPSRTLPYLAALTPKQYETRIIDELVDTLSFDEDADLIVLTGMLRHMPRAIDIAKEFKKRGKPTVIGGVGAFAIQNEIEKSGIFESFIVGEVDEIWKDILDDFDRGQLKKRYECSPPAELKGLPHARFDLLNQKKYMKSFYDSKHPIIMVETSRGCPHDCKFCLVTRYFGKKMRYRPVEEVVEEIKYHRSKFIMFSDDNIAINPARARELFHAIEPLKVYWIGQFESAVTKDPELLRLAARSGCRGAVVGIESLVHDNLHSVNKSRNTHLDFKEVSKSFIEANVPLFASIIFGMDHDTKETIDWTIEQMIENRVDMVIPWILTPVPRTACHDDYKKEERILHKNYSLYDHWHAVMRPKKITVDELEKSMWKGLKRFYSLRQIMLRVYRQKNWSFKVSGGLYNLYFRRQIHKGLHMFAENAL